MPENVGDGHKTPNSGSSWAGHSRGIVAWSGGDRYFFGYSSGFESIAYDRMIRSGITRSADFEYRHVSYECPDWNDPRPTGKRVYDA